MLVKRKLKSGAFLTLSEVGEGPSLLQPSVQAALLQILVQASPARWTREQVMQLEAVVA